MPCWAPAQFGRFDLLQVINKKEKESASMDERTARATYQPCYIYFLNRRCVAIMAVSPKKMSQRRLAEHTGRL
jgi:hypothetical protein